MDKADTKRMEQTFGQLTSKKPDPQGQEENGKDLAGKALLGNKGKDNRLKKTRFSLGDKGNP